MFSLYLVLLLLILEMATIALLLLPYVNRFTTPIIARLLQRIRLPMRIIMGILSFFLFESFVEMRKYQEVIATSDPNMRFQRIQFKFRSERNFYLYCFTVTLFLIIMRIEEIISRYQSLKTRYTEIIEKYEGPKDAEAKKND